MLAGWVTDQNPADRHRRNTGMVTKCGAGGDEQPALLGVVPLDTTTLVQTVFLFSSTALSFGKARPFSGVRPR